jgi:tetratricopeptide (TPR) repeat protein
MKTILIYSIFLLLVAKLSIAQEPDNKRPRYGDVKKSQKFIDMDNKFIETMEKQFGSRDIAAKEALIIGWELFSHRDYETAMLRFNQAWLLDSTLTEVNCGFGAILTARKEYYEALNYLSICYNLNPQDEEVIKHLAICYFNHAYFLKKSGQNDKWLNELNSAKFYLNKCILINPENAYAYGQLALAYYHENKLDSAKYYGILANKKDPKILHRGFKKEIGIN